jgi:hypothetical protein
VVICADAATAVEAVSAEGGSLGLTALVPGRFGAVPSSACGADAMREWDAMGLPWTSLDGCLSTLGPLTWATRYARTPGGQIAALTRRGTEKWQVSGYSDGLGWADCKTVGSAYVGSNPTPATSHTV